MKPPSAVGPHVIKELIEKAASVPAGCFVEIGVYQGGTAWYLNELAKQQNRKLYLYDTFTGIPFQDPDVDSHPPGDFSDTSLQAVQEAIPEAIIVQGIFPLSATVMEPIAFVHLDADQYQSYKESINYLLPLMVEGGVMWFDDVPCLNGATKAVREIFGEFSMAPCGKAYITIKGKNK